MIGSSLLPRGLTPLALALASAVALALPAEAQRASPPLVGPAVTSTLTEAQVAEIMANAIPAERLLDPASPGAPGSTAAASPEADGLPEVRGGVAGRSVALRIDEADYAESLRAAMEASAEPGAPENYGDNRRNSLYHYSDYLLMPQPVFAPYRAVGALFFQASDGFWYHCSAALIERAVILTAGHCVHEGGSGSDDGWNLAGFFVPGYSARDGASNGTTQRFGRCDIQAWFTTEGWYNEGALNGGYDVGLGTCSRLHDARWSYYNDRIPGTALGYLGVCYRNCRQAYVFLTQLGYPANYHGGGEMTVSQHLEVTGQEIPNWPGNFGNDYVHGSGMRGGSSGGPHIANIGFLSDVGVPGEFEIRNVVFAVTSWGFVGSFGEGLKIQGASALTGVDNEVNFRLMFNQACRHARDTHGRRTCTAL